MLLTAYYAGGGLLRYLAHYLVARGVFKILEDDHISAGTIVAIGLTICAVLWATRRHHYHRYRSYRAERRHRGL